MSCLRSQRGLQVGRRFTLKDRLRIGRAPDNQIQLADHLVSRYHAEVVREGASYIVRDLGSKNGIQVNDEATTEHRLESGDTLKIGETVFIYEVPRVVQTARLSNKLVRFESGGDLEVESYTIGGLPAPQMGKATNLIVHLGRLFECQGGELPEALNTMVHHLMGMFAASDGALFLRSASGEPLPLVALAEGEQLRINQEGLRIVQNEGKSLICSALPPTGTEPSSNLHPGGAMIVPLMQGDQTLGTLYLQRTDGETRFNRDDLACLLALARIVAGAARHAIQMDQIMLASADRPSEPFIGESAGAQAVREKTRRVATSDSTVLLTGETGTGKELIAHLIHSESPRRAGPFVAIDCSAIPANLVESELFGHEAGAFTGADRLKRGKIEIAEGGTVFLDEIGEMQIDLQPKLLRFIEELTFFRVGGVRPIHSDVRIIAATNRNLEEATRDGRFRQDLLYRLSVMPLHLPPLRDRIEDIKLLVEHFAPRLAQRLGKPYYGLVEEGWNLLEQYPWPGNVRELRHSLERAIILSDDGILRAEYFQLNLPEPAAEVSTGTQGGEDLEQTHSRSTRRDLHRPATLAEAEADAIQRALRYAQGNRGQAAKLLRIHRNTLTRKMQEYQIDV